MRRDLTAAAAIFLLSLGACGSGGDSGNVTQMRPANPLSDQLKGMTPLYRDLGLYRALRDNSQRCKKAEGGAFQQYYKNLAMWTVHCTDTGDWALFIAPNGDVQVRRCSEAGVLSLPACRRPAGVTPAESSPSTRGSAR
jgi:hypothetical protein